MQFIKEAEAIEVQVGAICDIVDQFRIQMEHYLLLLNLSNDLHVEAVVKLWPLFPLHSEESKKCRVGLFSQLIFGMSPESCFVITQAWERQKTASEVESSFRHFFGLVGDENEKKMRSYLMVGVEECRRKSYESYYIMADCAGFNHY